MVIEVESCGLTTILSHARVKAFADLELQSALAYRRLFTGHLPLLAPPTLKEIADRRVKLCHPARRSMAAISREKANVCHNINSVLLFAFWREALALILFFVDF